MPRRGKNGIKYIADMDGLAAVIGAVYAADGLGRKDRYIGKLIDAAHEVATDEFNMHIAADAASTNTLNHMFEWGTIGINPGGTRRINPLSPQARLWEHMLIGSGRSKGIAYNFVPSKVPVPKPTTTKTGIPKRYLDKLKGKHVFWNKAFIMESGTTVTISPKNPSGKLFIPIRGLGGEFRPEDLKRGFIMATGPVEATPGGNNVGTFNAYWQKFWSEIGKDFISAHMERSLTSDIEENMRKAERTRGDMRPAGLKNFNTKVKSQTKKSETRMMTNADRRARRNNG